MNRDIKFRVWDKERGRFHFGCSNVCLTLSGRLMWQFGFKSPDLLDNEESAQFTICQYTGLKDKSGVEIYEGDMVKSNKGVMFRIIWSENYAQFTGITPNIYTDKPYVRNVIYKSMRWVSEKCEVIGNIYENPELLEG